MTPSDQRSAGPVDLSKEVSEALREGRPVVALESTIISHGMPYPENRETAGELEEIVRGHGATPATIAVLGGRIHAGLTPGELEYLARANDITKVSRRDLPVVMARGGDGATTVAATMICAALAGIPLFATGGIGGVHRGGEVSWDVSADLQELARTNVAVVSAGAKAILDIGRTLEYLETHGVPVLGYGTDEFPAFYTRESGYPVDARVESPHEIARILQMKWRLGMSGGVLIGHPVPAGKAANRSEIDAKIEQAASEAEQCGIRGKELTPYLLSRLVELTAGRSLVTNIALVKNNAALAAEVAAAFAEAAQQS